MPNAKRPDIAPSRPMTINEVFAVTEIPAHKIVRMINDAVLPASVCLTRGKNKALRAYSMPMTIFGANEAEALSKRTRNEIMRLVGNFTRKNWRRLLEDSENAENLRYENGNLAIDLGNAVRDAMAGLKRLISAREQIVEDPNMRGGIPTIRGTRIGVYEISGLRKNEDLVTILKHYPSLWREHVELATLYEKAYPMIRSKTSSAKSRAKEYPGSRLIMEKVVEMSRPA